VGGTKASLNMLVTRAVDAGDLQRAQLLRSTAASSPERQAAVQRRQKKVTGK